MVMLVLLALIEIGLFRWGIYKTYMEENGSLFTRTYFFEDKMEDLRCRYYKCCAWYKTGRISVSEMQDRYEFRYVHEYNSNGFRNGEISSESNRKVLCLGDSFTEGQGAPQDSTWPVLLESMLPTQLSSELEIVNAGVAGTDVIYIQKFLEDLLFSYEPDFVILAQNASDISELSYRGGKERFRPNCKLNFKDKGILSYLYNISYIARHISHDFLRLNNQLITKEEVQRRSAGAVPLIIETILEIHESCLRNDVGFMLVLHPYENELGSIDNWSNEVMAAVDSAGVNSLSLFPKFNQAVSEQILFWEMDRHCNSKGYLLMAEEICNHLVENQFL